MYSLVLRLGSNVPAVITSTIFTKTPMLNQCDKVRGLRCVENVRNKIHHGHRGLLKRLRTQSRPIVD